MPRAWATIATSVPTKMYASGHGFQDSVGNGGEQPADGEGAEGRAADQQPRSRQVAKRTAMEPSWACCLPRCHGRQPHSGHDDHHQLLADAAARWAEA